MLAVEWRDACHAEGALLKAAHIDAIAVGLRARHVEALYSAHGAKMMLCRSSVEAVGGDPTGAGEQPEALLGYDQMHIAGHAADRAIAVLDFDLVGRQHLEGDGAAMAPALLPAQGTFGHVRHFR